ncbi:hypothetical protein Lalb_Chr21g0318511 [Lupinus albus]|uniref:Transmembrane protein n=1 Tax=Lupinus albus TaxID=3870 RepID=A0A6A4NHT6_LUPAL|nr:hypothetical protein Lalb_Chr21g0318511 [Lupinus albus]
MKVAVNVEEHQAPILIAPSSPLPMKSSSIVLPSVFTCTFIIHAYVLFIILVSIGAF